MAACVGCSEHQSGVALTFFSTSHAVTSSWAEYFQKLEEFGTVIEMFKMAEFVEDHTFDAGFGSCYDSGLNLVIPDLPQLPPTSIHFAKTEA